jgi:hypothetical protein
MKAAAFGAHRLPLWPAMVSDNRKMTSGKSKNRG